MSTLCVMASPATQFLINVSDPAKAGIVQSIYSTGSGGVPRFIDSSGENFAISAVIPTVNPASGRYYDFASLESARTSGSLILALGDLEEPPTSGTFPLSYASDSTGLTALAYNIPAATLESALNANPGFIAGGFTCTVSKAGIDYQIAMNQVGARSLLVSATNLLLPTSTVYVSRKTLGTVSVKDVQIVRLVQLPAAMQDTWSALASVPAAGVTITAGASSYLWSITMPPGAYTGSASVVVTINSVPKTFVINWNDTAATLQTSIQALSNVGAGNATVTGSQGGPFAIEFASSLTSGITMVGTNINIAAPIGITGWLNPNTVVMLEKFDAAGNPDSISLNLAFQIKYPDDPFPRTVLQVGADVYKSVINTATIAPAPSGNLVYIPYAFAGTLTSGVDSGAIDISALGLSAAPTQAIFIGLDKHAAGDANITGSVIRGSVTATSVPFELNAVTDNANRIPHILVVP